MDNTIFGMPVCGRGRFYACVGDERTEQEKGFPLGIVCDIPTSTAQWDRNVLGGSDCGQAWEAQAAEGHFLLACSLTCSLKAGTHTHMHTDVTVT